MGSLSSLPETEERFAVKQAEQHFHAGNDYIGQGQLEKAIREYNEALALDPGNSNTLENLAITLAKTGDMEKGIAAMEKAVKAAPNSAGKHASLGIMLHAVEREDAAMEQYRMAIRRNPGMAGIYYNMAVLFAARNDFVRSWKSLELAEMLGYDVKQLRERLLQVSSEVKFHFPKETGGYYLRQIVVESAEEAAEVSKALQKGEDFNELVVGKSLPQYNDNGGYLGHVADSEMEPQVLKAVKRLAPFQISKAVRAGGHYHIFQRLVLPEELLVD